MINVNKAAVKRSEIRIVHGDIADLGSGVSVIECARKEPDGSKTLREAVVVLPSMALARLRVTFVVSLVAGDSVVVERAKVHEVHSASAFFEMGDNQWSSGSVRCEHWLVEVLSSLNFSERR